MECVRYGKRPGLLRGQLHIDIMPVLLCSGLRLFEHTGTEQIRLERRKVVELPAGRTHLRFNIVK